MHSYPIDFAHQRRRPASFWITVSLIVLTCAVGESLGAGRTAPKFHVDPSPPPRDGKLTLSFAPVAEKVAPSVVNVFSTRAVRDPAADIPFFNDPLFRRFFGGRGAQPPSEPRIQQGLGSGVIVSEDGYIITNNHVVESSEEVRVVLASGKEYSATVVGTDPASEIAVVKIDATNLPAITMADSSQLKVGDVALAIGNPFGVGQTVTLGIVSAVGRAGFGIVDYEDFIQTDASINPGNSGGALTDVTGRLVGINTAIISRTGGNQGIGFAVPINMARHITEQIISKGRVERGFLGVHIQPLTPELAKEFGAEGSKGALIASVSQGSPAAKAGLREGDVVTAFNGQEIVDSRQLRLTVAQTPPDTKARITVLRGGKQQNLSVTLGTLPVEQAAMGSGDIRTETGTRRGASLEGLQLSEITPDVRQELNLPKTVGGLIVIAVQPGSAAARAGIQPGDVITELDRKPVKSVDEAITATRGKRNGTLLKVWSQGASRYVFLQQKEPAKR